MANPAPDDGVVVDLVVEDGVIYLELVNLSDRPALNVRSSFDAPLIDVAGRDISELRLFRHIEFLGPRRRIRTLLNSLDGHFGGDGAARIAVTVDYERPGEPRSATKVSHDLEVHRQLLYRVTSERPC
jgi:hypothetical protein